MDFLKSLQSSTIEGGSVLTIGVFDGVHRGHQALIAYVKAEARKRSVASGVITFTNHPRTVLAPGSTQTYLGAIDERLALLRDTGVGHLVPLIFTRQLSQLSYQEFADLLIKNLGMQCLVIGPDFAMGKGRQGTPAALAEFGSRRDFLVLPVNEPLKVDGEIASTTAVRKHLIAGDMSRVERLLGRPYSLTGPVVHGEGRGHLLGFPTANIDIPPDITLPSDGVYSTIACFDGQRLSSATSIGVRPTFGGGRRTVETFVLDFDGDLYGKQVAIELVHRIRDEQKFASVGDLIKQMTADVIIARETTAQRNML